MFFWLLSGDMLVVRLVVCSTVQFRLNVVRSYLVGWPLFVVVILLRGYVSDSFCVLSMLDCF